MESEDLEPGDVVKNSKYGHVVVDETFKSPPHGIRIKGHTYERWEKKKIIVDLEECEVCE